MNEITADDGSELTLEQAESAWKAGDFSDWVCQHGFPLTIDGTQYPSWDGVEEALSDLRDSRIDNA